MNQGENLHLVIVEESRSGAEAHASMLHHAGYNVDYDHVNNIKSLVNFLGSTHADLVLYGEGANLPDLESVSALLHNCDPEIPLTAIAGGGPTVTTGSDTKPDADNHISSGQPDALPLTLRRELDAALLKRRVDMLENALQENETRYRQLVDTSSDAIAYIHEGKHLYANESYLRMFGFRSLGDAEGTKVVNVVITDQQACYRSFLRNHEQGDHTTDTLRTTGFEASGETFKAVIKLSAAKFDGNPCTQILVRTEQRGASQLEEKLRMLSRQDILTGLANRQHFMRILEENLNSRPDEQMTQAVIYILLDGFKAIREEIGIIGGDMVLCNIASLIHENCHPDDVIARFGDHAFTILHHGENPEKIQELAENLREKIASHTSDIHGHAVTMTGSLGICHINRHINSAQDIVSRADLACEVASSSGGNRIHTHSTAVDDQMNDEHEQHRDEMIRKTINEGRFYLVYQPIVSLKGKAGERYEVLLRILDENDNAILPGQFISIAEKSGLGGEIDRWVIDTALQALAEMQHNGKDASFFIKLSRSSMFDLELPKWIRQKVRELQLESQRIVFEIPEAVATGNFRNTMMIAKALNNIPCRVAIEHYGTDAGQSRLLNHLSFDLIKIDRALINDLATDKTNQAKVRAVVEAAHTKGRECIAECVDDTAKLAMLWQSGVDYIQGYFVQEPSRELEYDFEGEIA